MSDLRLRVPATSANLGPGFDCLGVALAWHNEVSVERDPSAGLTITAAGEGADAIPRDASNLVVRALETVLPRDGGFRIHLTNAIPFGRGFGSSAAAIVAGLVAGRALRGETWNKASLVAAAASIEGHADNVAPCVFGGASAVAGADVLPLGTPSGIEVLACVAPVALSTEAARRALPAQVPFSDAVANAARAVLLAASLALADPAHLLAATDDALHQPARFALAPDAGRLVSALRAKGIAAFLAGAGPSVAALVVTSAGAAEEATARRLAPDGWEVRRVAIDPSGTTVVEAAQPLA